MRALIAIAVIAMMGTSIAAGQPKCLVTPQDILSAHAIDNEVEIILARSCCLSDVGPTHSLDVQFSFPLDLSVEVAKQSYIRSIAFTTGSVVVRWSLPDVVSANRLAESLEMKRPKT